MPRFWLTASLINNILIDFQQLLADHSQMVEQGTLTLNEKLNLDEWINSSRHTSGDIESIVSDHYGCIPDEKCIFIPEKYFHDGSSVPFNHRNA